MKRTVYVALVAMFLLAGMVSVVSAATTNAEYKASLVILPKIISTDTIDTVVTIGNDSNSVPVFVHCEWMNEYQDVKDFEFSLTPGEIAWFLASTGVGSVGVDSFVPWDTENPASDIGSLTCFAADPATDLPVVHNHLFSTATIYDFANGIGVGYNGYGFRKYAAGTATDARLDLNNVEYDACPAYLLGTFMFTGASFEDLGYNVEAVTTDVTLYSCEQDMRQDQEFTYTKARFTIFDENEGRSTNTTVCFKCWMEITLDSRTTANSGIQGLVASAGVGTIQNWNRWMFNVNNGYTFGYFRVQGVNTTTGAACGFDGATIQATPLIGTIFRTVSFEPVADGAPAELIMTGSVLQSTSTSDTSGFILYEQESGGDIEANNR